MQDETYMKLALQMAESTLGQTSPNPAVGAVIVKEGAIVGMGAHLKAGEAHAEIQALRMAGERAEGSTVYVTLEPCSHHGKTPPCAEALIQAGVKRVVIADAFDSNPSVSGKGVERLRESGISVATGVLEQEARALNEAFHYFMRRQKPFVTLKTAMTLDGKIATHSGSSRWITGEAARREVHRLRHRHDAILVGIGTVIKDNPSLTTRLPVQGLHPIRIIMDSTLRIPLDAKVVTDGEAPTWIFTTDDMDQKKKTLLKERGVEIFSTGPGPRVEIHTMLNILAEKQVLSLLLEGGGEVNGAFLEARAVSKVVAFMAPKLIGGTAAPGPIGGEGVAHMEEAIALENVEVETVGKDVKVTGYPAYSGGD